MILPALVFAFWAVACGEVKDEAVYKQGGDAHTEYETMNEEPHYIETESEYTPFDDDVSTGQESVDRLDNDQESDALGNPELETEDGERADDDGSIGDDNY